MRRHMFRCTLLALTVAAIAFSQAASTRFINLVDTPAVVKFSASGQAQVPLDPKTASVIDLTGFRKVHIRVGSTTAKAMMVNMGKISGATLSQMYNRPLNQIQTFDVVGPQMVLWLTGGSPNTTEKVQIWVYLSS